MNEAGNNTHISAETVPLREKLRQIRDSGHPASPWARNVVQCMDELWHLTPNDPDMLRALGWNVAMMEQTMARLSETPLGPKRITPDEIAAIFGLRRHVSGNQ